MGCVPSSLLKPKTSKPFQDAGVPTSSLEQSEGDEVLEDEESLRIDELKGKNGETRWRYEPGKALDHYPTRADLEPAKPVCKYFDRESSGFDYFEKDEYVELRDTLDEKYGRHLLLQYAREHGDASYFLVKAWILMHKYHLLKDSADRYRVGKELLEKYVQSLLGSEKKNCTLDSHRDDLSQAQLLKSKASEAAIQMTSELAKSIVKETEQIESKEVSGRNSAMPADLGIVNGSQQKMEQIPNDVKCWCSENASAIQEELKRYGEEKCAPNIKLFFELQGIAFKDMISLHESFKRSSTYNEKYVQIKRIVYNKVKPNDFTYLDIIGKGGFGKVVHVIKKSTKEHYAMKIQAKDRLLSTWGNTMEHVEIERDVLVANERFPFIISLRYAFQTEEYAFLVLDLAEAGSLRDIIESAPGFKLEEAQVRLYVAEIVLALQCLHDHGIIYRDLKPENVLLRADGHITLADMGLAGFYYQKKYYRAEGEVIPNEKNHHKKKHLFWHETDCGTPLYRPPEMIRNEKYGPGVDWFMLGVLCFECLFGYLPFEPKGGLTESNLEMINDPEAELKCLMRRKLEIPDYASEGVASFIRSLLALDPNQRLGNGPSSENLDMNSLMAHPFFWPLDGPLAKRLDWNKVLNKEYEPVFKPIPKLLKKKKRKFSSFEALLRYIKRQSKSKWGKDKDPKKIETHNEGKKLSDGLQHYFDNWDYVCPEAIQLELEAEKPQKKAESP